MRTIPIISTTATAPQEHVALCRAYGAAQERCSRVMAQQRADIARLESEVMRLRAAVVVRDTALAGAGELGAARGVPAGKRQERGPRGAARLRAWQWLMPWWRAPAAAPRHAHDAADLTTAELIGRQGGWLSPGLDWPG